MRCTRACPHPRAKYSWSVRARCGKKNGITATLNKTKQNKVENGLKARMACPQATTVPCSQETEQYPPYGQRAEYYPHNARRRYAVMITVLERGDCGYRRPERAVHNGRFVQSLRHSSMGLASPRDTHVPGAGGGCRLQRKMYLPHPGQT